MNELIEQKLKEYNAKNLNAELNAKKEIAQELILFALGQTDFFDKAFFIGGTSLRIVHGLARFSEDLDFSTLDVDHKFDLDHYMEKVLSTLHAYGMDMNVSKKKNDAFVKSREFKEDSEKWKLSFPKNGLLKKVMIKLEIDSNPPLLSKVENKFLDFPQLHRISVGTPETLFAGKMHALLCRPYTKGRDWYDFLFYVKKGTDLNYSYLEKALEQMGPFKDQKLQVDLKFVKLELSKKIQSLDWKEVKKDVERFLRPEELKSLDFWSADLFLDRVSKL
ncbi:MAG: nucleotidyl transferase AbiEii/AbiGii toxin family protein [Bacteriovoracaceae bacterium]